MKKMTCLAFGLAACAAASPVDLSSGGSFTLKSGQQLTLQFSVWNYGLNNPGTSPYPTSIGLQLLGTQPSSSLSPIPDTSTSYYSNYLLQGWVHSADGSASAALTSPDAARLGLGAGSLLLEPATVQRGSSLSSVSAIEADAALSLTLSQQIFGPNVTSRQSSAMIELLNLGSDLVISGGPGYSLKTAFSVPGVTGLGNAQTSGITLGVSVVDAPEPGTVAMMMVALCAMVGFFWKRRRAV